MVFVKTFKGYEDKIIQLDAEVNAWLSSRPDLEVVDIKTVLAHETGGRAGMGDVLYTVIYKAASPVD